MLDAFDDVTQEFTELRIDWLKVMKKSPFYLFFLLLSFVTKIACATSFGFVSTASISSVDALPAICLPNDAEAPFLVGLITVSESYVRNPGSWGVALKDGATPLALKPGECIKFEAVPEGYEVDRVQASVDDPVRTHQSNFVGTLNVCEAMRQANVKRVVFASSAAVYGNNGEGCAIDEDTPKAPLTPYASDMLASEYYFDFYRRQHALEPVIFRFFNIFGPRQDPSSPYSGVISIFSERAQKGLPITIFGDGEQTRDFFYVEDLVGLLVQALEAPHVEDGAINVGMNQATSLTQMLGVLAEVLGEIPPVSHSPARAGDIRHSRANNDRLLKRFKLAETTPMSVGLAKLLGKEAC